MRKRKRLFGALMIIAALVIMALPVSEADAATSASDFVIEGSTLVRYRGTDTAVSVPNTVEVIGEGAFEDNAAVELVVIPDSVERIEAYAFWGCDKLAMVTLGKGLTEVGDYAFANCMGLKQMTLPSNILSIGVQAFRDCVNMTDITIPAETFMIHESAFDGCARLTIHCEAGTPADIYARSFYERQREMPEYEDVPGYQPGDGDAEDGILPEPTPEPVPTPTPDYSNGDTLGTSSVVGNSAFIMMNPDNMSVREQAPEQSSGGALPGGLPSSVGNLADVIGSMISIGAVERLPKYTIVDGRVIADQAFYRSDVLERIVLPDGIEEIGQFSFARSSVTEAVLPEGVTDIGYGAFYHCDSLGRVELPETVMNVEPKAFEYTAWLEAFRQGGEPFLVSGGVLVAYAGSDANVSVPGGVRVIAAEAFAGHGEIESVRLPDSVLVIGESAFEDCVGLRQVTMGEGVERIKDRAFSGCDSLEFLRLPASVRYVGLRAFGETEVSYGGSTPESTYEASATRLSNESSRGLEADQSAPGVTVEGAWPSAARLEGAMRSYLLTVAQRDGGELREAWERVLEEEAPENMVVYELRLTDSSLIPLTKLGRSGLTVILPVPEALLGQELRLVTLDRNGQMERLGVERVMMEGTECFRFRTTQLSQLGIYGAGEAAEGTVLREVSVNMSSMSPAPSGGGNAFRSARLITGAALLLTGMPLFFGGMRRRKAGQR